MGFQGCVDPFLYVIVGCRLGVLWRRIYKLFAAGESVTSKRVA